VKDLKQHMSEHKSAGEEINCVMAEGQHVLLSEDENEGVVLD
jgi:hypothetical protein